MWSADRFAVRACRNTIDQLRNLGYTAPSYILLVKLLKAMVQLDPAELEYVQYCWKDFSKDAVQYLQSHYETIPFRLGDCRLFTP